LQIRSAALPRFRPNCHHRAVKTSVLFVSQRRAKTGLRSKPSKHDALHPPLQEKDTPHVSALSHDAQAHRWRSNYDYRSCNALSSRREVRLTSRNHGRLNTGETWCEPCWGCSAVRPAWGAAVSSDRPRFRACRECEACLRGRTRSCRVGSSLEGLCQTRARRR